MPPPCDASRRPASTIPEGGQNTEDRLSGEASLCRPGVQARCAGRAPATTPGRSCSPSAARIRPAAHPHRQRPSWRHGRGCERLASQLDKAGDQLPPLRCPSRRDCSTIRQSACTAVVGSPRCSVVAKRCSCASRWTDCQPAARGRGQRSDPGMNSLAAPVVPLSACAFVSLSLVVPRRSSTRVLGGPATAVDGGVIGAVSSWSFCP